MRGQWIVLPIIAVLAAPAWAAGSGVGAALAEHCVACHGAEGVSEDAKRPNLAGQKAKYLVRQLRRFRDSFLTAHRDSTVANPDAVGAPKKAERHNPVMEHQAALLSDDAIHHLAGHFSSLPCRRRNAPAVKPRPALADTCAQCHGRRGINKSDEIPNLAGQNEWYLIKQLASFRRAGRAGAGDAHVQVRADATMNRQAAQLSDGNIKALASYFASLDCR